MGQKPPASQGLLSVTSLVMQLAKGLLQWDFMTYSILLALLQWANPHCVLTTHLFVKETSGSVPCLTSSSAPRAVGEVSVWSVSVSVSVGLYVSVCVGWI